MYLNTGINRFLCDVLEDMRKCLKTNNFSYLEGLIEEAQTMGNRMEGALNDKKDYRRWKEAHPKLKKEIKELQKEIEDLDDKLDSLKKRKQQEK